jgi:integrase/recombinase XerC
MMWWVGLVCSWWVGAAVAPAWQVFEAMLEGWRNQRLARNLTFTFVEAGEAKVRALMRHVEVFPWEWTSAMADEWFADMRGVRHLARSTLRGHQGAIRGFCSFITDPAVRSRG